MNHPDFNRRDFNKLTMAAFGGMVAGSMAGCSPVPPGTPKPGATADNTQSKTSPTAKDEKVAENDWLGKIHVCRGLNACKDQGKSGKNDCAGQGTCATAKSHSCHGGNDCRFQGGCGETAGRNACKDMSECSVPLMEDTWTKVRPIFEEAMKKAGKPVGAAPAAEPEKG